MDLKKEVAPNSEFGLDIESMKIIYEEVDKISSQLFGTGQWTAGISEDKRFFDFGERNLNVHCANCCYAPKESQPREKGSAQTFTSSTSKVASTLAPEIKKIISTKQIRGINQIRVRTAPVNGDAAIQLSSILNNLNKRDRAHRLREEARKIPDENISELLDILTEEIILINTAKRIPRSCGTTSTSETVKLPDFPISKAKDLEDFESQLSKNDAMKDALRRTLLKLGSDDMSHFLKRSIRKLLSDDIASLYTWSHSNNKNHIQNFTIIKIIKDQCISLFPRSDEKSIYMILHQHFAHAKSRLKKRGTKTET